MPGFVPSALPSWGGSNPRWFPSPPGHLPLSTLHLCLAIQTELHGAKEWPQETTRTVLITAANIDEGLAKTSHMHFPFCCFPFSKPNMNPCWFPQSTNQTCGSSNRNKPSSDATKTNRYYSPVRICLTWHLPPHSENPTPSTSAVFTCTRPGCDRGKSRYAKHQHTTQFCMSTKGVICTYDVCTVMQWNGIVIVIVNVMLCYVCRYVSVHVCLYVYVCMYVCLYVCMYVCM